MHCSGQLSPFPESPMFAVIFLSSVFAGSLYLMLKDHKRLFEGMR
jgi:hypothetical protein